MKIRSLAAGDVKHRILEASEVAKGRYHQSGFADLKINHYQSLGV